MSSPAPQRQFLRGIALAGVSEDPVKCGAGFEAPPLGCSGRCARGGKDVRVRRSLTLPGVVGVWVALGGALVLMGAPAPTGSNHRRSTVHDPSTIVQSGGEYWLFSTGQGIRSWRSRDLTQWEEGPRVFESPPGWTTNAVPGFRGHIWAPDIIRSGERWLLYYSVSTWGKNRSVIGLATTPTLDPADPHYAWTDEGPVIQSVAVDDFNAIDPGLTKGKDGTLWMSFGSFWSGLKLVQLDPATGKRMAGDGTMHALAYHPQIEAPSIWEYEDRYYLFVNWGLCCRGTNSTYNIRVGRSADVTGPYVDRKGTDLMLEGGELLLGTEGSRIGPGHASVYTEGGTNWMSYHFYDGDRAGAATLGIRRIELDAGGWPIVRGIIR
jgi:arabinan endo-1,5-alpha-L-arabinosidase